MTKISCKIIGEMVLACNCDLFCPCVTSLGKAPPTYGYWQTWAALKIHQGFAGDESFLAISKMKLGRRDYGDVSACAGDIHQR